MATKTRSFFISFVTFCSIVGVSLAVIAFGRGYRLDIKKSGIKPTGLISVTSDPIGAQVYVEDKLKTATNNSFSIDPGWYTISISKEGYIPWQKKLRVQGEVVSRADAFLFPSSPSLTPITTLGIAHPSLSPNGSKIAYTIPNGHLDTAYTKKAGLWVYELTDGPMGRNRDPIQIAPVDPLFDVTTASLTWSPDGTQILAVTKSQGSKLYQINRPGTSQTVTTTYQTLLKDWNSEQMTKDIQKLSAFPQPIIDLATSSARLIALSPDETKFLYTATASATIPKVINPPLIGTNSTEENRNIVPGNIYVYDAKEDKNFLLLEQKEIPVESPTPSPAKRTPTAQSAAPNPSPATPLHWFPTSRHLILTLGNKIDVMEYDRTNWVTIYSGPFTDSFVAPWSNGSRIIIMTNLNADATALPNLYTVNLR